LAQDEERLLQTVHRADGNRNDVFLTHRRPDDDAATGAGDAINFVAVIRSTDRDPTDTSPLWAWQRGPTERSICIAIAEAIVNAPPPPGTSVWLHPDVEWFADRIRENAGPTPSTTDASTRWAQLYAAACGEVLTAANVCLAVANEAVGARNMAAQRPQHEISIRHFAEMAEKKEQEFVPLYRSFEEACVAARDAAAQLFAAQPEPLLAELLLATTVDEKLLNDAATVKSILRARFGPAPAAFIEGVNQANSFMQNPQDDGNIYKPLPSDTRNCPWCAETIKAAAVICRFCGREVQDQSNPHP